jgi:hypothetical protein
MSILQYFEVRLRQKGQIVSKHIPANSAEQAASYSGGRVLSVRKIHPEDIIGIISMRQIQEGNTEALKIQMRIEQERKEKKLNSDPIMSNASLTSIVFNNTGNTRKEKKSPYKGREDYKKEKERSNRKYGIETNEV